jgi:hypothetical protein
LNKPNVVALATLRGAEFSKLSGISARLDNGIHIDPFSPPARLG